MFEIFKRSKHGWDFAGFQDLEFLQKAIKMVLRCIWKVILHFQDSSFNPVPHMARLGHNGLNSDVQSASAAALSAGGVVMAFLRVLGHLHFLGTCG